MVLVQTILYHQSNVSGKCVMEKRISGDHGGQERSHSPFPLEFFPPKALGATGTIARLLNPLIETRQMEIGFIFSAATERWHTGIGGVESIHADHAFIVVIVSFQFRRHGLGHLRL